MEPIDSPFISNEQEGYCITGGRGSSPTNKRPLELNPDKRNTINFSECKHNFNGGFPSTHCALNGVV